MHVYYVKTSQQNTAQKTYICASEDVSLFIINNIHNLSFLFSGKIMSLQDQCSHLATQCGVVNFVPSYLPQKKGQSRVQLILVYFDK